MLFTTILPLLLTTPIVLCTPVPVPIPQIPTSTCTTLTTRLDYYQGYQSPTNCGVDVFANATITSGSCITITTQGLMLFPADVPCTYSIWKGVTDCSGDVTETFELGVRGEEKGNTGGDGTCVGTGVMDGGRFYHGSGFLSCGC